MNFKKLHEKYKDAASPSVEMQIRWLQRLGFLPQVIDQAMILGYGEIERGEITFNNGGELNAYLKEKAHKIREDDLTDYITNLEKLEEKMRKAWDDEQRRKKPWYKRLLGL